MARPTICFVTYELAPVNRGGAGVVIAGLAEHLARAGFGVHVIADMPPGEVEEYRRHVVARGVPDIHVHELASLADPVPDLPTIFQAKARAFRDAVYALARRVPLSAVEFFEYAGAAFDTLTLRKPGDALGDATVSVRIHGSLSMIDQSTCGPSGDPAHPVRFPAERHMMYRMEQWSMALADVVLAPLAGVGAQYASTYGIDPRRVRTCPPPMEPLLAEIGTPRPRRADANEVLYWGKLHPVKGVETFVEGCLGIAESRPELRFALVGPDTNDAPGGKSMREYLEALIPEDRKDRFRFEPFLPRSTLASRAAGALCAVVPSKSESFCLVAHELARAGCPLVLTDIPAFAAFEEGRDALHFDGSPAELAIALDRVERDPVLRERLAGAGARMRYAAAEPVYAALPPPSRTTRNIANFARREVESLAALGGTERDLQGVLRSKGWRLVTTGRELRDRAREASSGMARLLGRRSPAS